MTTRKNAYQEFFCLFSRLIFSKRKKLKLPILFFINLLFHLTVSYFKSQQVVNPVQALLNQVQQQQPQPQQQLKPSISLTSSLVTPPATWTTSMTTTSYVTTVTHTETQEVPIILRGQKVSFSLL